MNQLIESLNNQYALSSQNLSLDFKIGRGGLPVAEIKSPLANALISLQGAHVLSWKPESVDEVIWLSEDATFSPGKSVRGGIPVCWPWFGAHDSDSSFPAHGFARTVLWQVVETALLKTGEVQICFRLETENLEKPIQKMWPTPTKLDYRLTIGKSLKLELTTYNKSEQPMVIGEALHTYFNIDDITLTRVTGLHGAEYLDKPDEFKQKKQDGDILISQEVDRVYMQTKADICIHNQQRKILISKQGSQSTVVWNPWEQVAEKMADLGHDGYLSMLCVESANAAGDVVTIEAGESHHLCVEYTIEDI